MAVPGDRAPHQCLRPPHGATELCLPNEQSDLRRFLVRAMERREFQQASSEREQVHLLRRWGESALPGGLSMQKIADFMCLGRSTIQYHLSRPYDFIDGCSPGQIGRPPLLNEEQERAVVAFVTNRFELRNPASYEDIRGFLQTKYGLVVELRSLYDYMARNEHMRTVIGEPVEDVRVFARTSEIRRYLERISEIISVAHIPSAFVVNIDESGFEEFVDTRKRTCIVPAKYELNSIPIPVSRKEKRATLLAGICADGTGLKPMVILPRTTIDEELVLYGYTPDKIHYGATETGFMNENMFGEWLKYSFFPEMRERRARFRYDGQILLIMDGFGVHHSESALEKCTEENIIVQFIPPHTSDQVQPCDLGIFAKQKRWQKNVLLPKRLSRQTGQVIRMLDALRMATTYKNITNAFRKGGIDCFYDKTKMVLMARVDPEKATSVRKLWDEIEVLEEHQRRKRIQIM